MQAGPMEEGIPPIIASERVTKFQVLINSYHYNNYNSLFASKFSTIHVTKTHIHEK